MTRINAGIDPTELCDKHLLAEYRELPRIRSVLQARIDKGGNPLRGKPKDFTLGRGHVLYFLDKGSYLCYRWTAIVKELQYRGVIATLSWRQWPAPAYCGTMPEAQEVRARSLVRCRIIERLIEGKTKPKWTGRSVPEWIPEGLDLW